MKVGSFVKTVRYPKMGETRETIVVRREELMVSATRSASPTLRIAHFLNPTLASIKSPDPKNPAPSLATIFEPEKWTLNVTFNGWREPTANWKSWVRHLEGKYQSVWKRSGIYDAIMSSTCSVGRDGNLILGLAEKWCPETNTFVFPWAEATITLEDVTILGGYSVLGSPAFYSSLESRELEEIEEKLKEARTELGRGPARKACQYGWMKKFMFSGSEIEHEAFLSLWLERFVFNDSENIIRPRVFSVAIHLAKGEPVALAPAVLASIYRDLGLLKATIVAAEDEAAGVLAVTLWSPMHLVQLWAWERFPAFQPKPNFIRNGDPRSALWEKVKGKKVENVRLALDSAGETFQWRPYASGLYNMYFLKFYKEKEEWQDLRSNQDLLSFAFCLRVSELVGLGCIEQYLPHRVARQFGFDQDIPCNVARSKDNYEIPELAWINYIRPFMGTKLFVPSKFFEPDVTVRYLEWWKQSVLGLHDQLKDANNAGARRKRNKRKRSKWVSRAWIGRMGDGSNNNNNADVLHSPSARCHIENYSDEDIKHAIDETLSSCDMKNSVASKPSNDFRHLAGQTQSLSPAKANNGGLKVMNPQQKYVESIIHDKSEIGESLTAMRDTTDNEAWMPTCTNSRNGGESSAHTFEIPGLALESRMAVLEKAIAELKGVRFGRKFS